MAKGGLYTFVILHYEPSLLKYSTTHDIGFFFHHIYINDNFVDQVIVFIPVFKNLTLEELSFDLDTLRSSLAYARVCKCVSKLMGHVLRNTNFTQRN